VSLFFPFLVSTRRTSRPLLSLTFSPFHDSFSLFPSFVSTVPPTSSKTSPPSKFSESPTVSLPPPSLGRLLSTQPSSVFQTTELEEEEELHLLVTLCSLSTLSTSRAIRVLDRVREEEGGEEADKVLRCRRGLFSSRSSSR